MPLLHKVLGFGAFGLAIRAFQLGILKKPVVSGPMAYGLSAVGWGGVGYMVYGWEQRQNELIAEKHELFKQRQQEGRQTTPIPVPA